LYEYFHGKEGHTDSSQANQFVEGISVMFSHVYDKEVQVVVDTNNSANPTKKKLKPILHQMTNHNFYAGVDIKLEYLTEKSLTPAALQKKTKKT